MSRKITVILILATLYLACGEIIRFGKPGEYKFVKDGSPVPENEVDGKVISRIDSTTVTGVYNYRSGKQDGKQVEYFNDGKTVSAEWEMTGGIRTGYGKEYYENGSVKFERDLDDKGNGLGTEYYQSGMKMRERLYVNGKQEHVSFYNHDIKGNRYKRTSDELFQEAQEYGALGMYGHAIEDYTEFLKTYPGHEKCDEVKFLIAFNYHNNLDEIELAKKNYREFLEMFPDSPLAVSAKFELENIGKNIENIDIFKE